MRNQSVNQRIDQYGCSVQIISEDANIHQTVKAIIQPLRSAHKLNHGMEYLQAGCVDKNSFLYIGPAGVRVDTYPFDTKMIAHDDTYTLQRAQKFCFNDEILYIWAVLRKYVPEETDIV